MSSKRGKWLLIGVLFIGFLLRFYNLNWDKGYHFHPDERMITIVADKIRLPENDKEWSEILTSESSLNPKFFAYGSLPIYLLRIVGDKAKIINHEYGSYGKLNLVGRFLVILFDVGSILLIYIVGKKMFNWEVGSLGALFYSVCVFGIQNSHFYTVDIILNFFVLLFIYRCLLFFEKASIKNSLLMGIVFGMILATKITGVLSGFVVGGVLLELVFDKKVKLGEILKWGLVFSLAGLVSWFLFEPFAFLDFGEFSKQVLVQIEMNKSAFTFPYTLQYVGSLAYWYPVKNIYLWGLGAVLGVICFLGVLGMSVDLVRRLVMKRVDKRWWERVFVMIFFWGYFLVVGKSAVKFMRYYLVLYPTFCLMGGWVFYKMNKYLEKKVRKRLLVAINIILVVGVVFWPVAFISIYAKEQTKIEASYFINEKIEEGAVIGVEHWDDRLPLWGQSNFLFEELPLYEVDSEEKWQLMREKLDIIDYIVIASNRLYVPLTKLDNIYPVTKEYYNDLFSGRLGFRKVAEFKSYPEIAGMEVLDDSADESFTVYDHPKVMIFKKEGGNEK